MERIFVFVCGLTVLLCSVHSQELIIEFIRQRADNVTQIVNEVTVDSTSTERLHIVCRINNIPNIQKVYNIFLNRLTSSGNAQNLATMQPDFPARPGYQTPYLYAGSGITGIQAVGTFSLTNPTIGISIPVSSLSCNNADSYQCKMNYGFAAGNDPVNSADAEIMKNLTVTVLPTSMELRAYNQSSAFGMNEISQSGTESMMAQFYIDQKLKLTCKAFLGTYNNGRIYWKKSNIIIVAGSGSMANFIPNQGDYEEGQVVANGCQFEKTDSIIYNMTDQDSTRTASNPLQFQCYIGVSSSTGNVALPEATLKNFYIKVARVNDPTASGVASAGSGDAGVIAGAVIGSLVGIVIIVLLVYFLWYRRRTAGDDYTTKEEQGASNPNLAPEPQYAQSTKKGHENRAMDERTESSHARYANDTFDRNDKKDRNDRKDRNGQRGGGRKNHAMDHSDDEDYHSRDGSTHMGLDPEHGGIGTGV